MTVPGGRNAPEQRSKNELCGERGSCGGVELRRQVPQFRQFLHGTPVARRFSGYPPLPIPRKCAFDPAPVFFLKRHRDLNSPRGRRQYLKSWYLSSVMVLVSWQDLHKLCQLLLSQKRTGSPRCGTMWSTTVAGTSLPSARQRTQSGCAFKKTPRAFCQRFPYPFSFVVFTSQRWAGRCSSQYI